MVNKIAISVGTTMFGLMGVATTTHAATNNMNSIETPGNSYYSNSQSQDNYNADQTQLGKNNNDTVLNDAIYNYYKTKTVQPRSTVANVSSPIYDYYKSFINNTENLNLNTITQAPQNTESGTEVQTPQNTESGTEVQTPQNTESGTEVQAPQNTESGTEVQTPQNTESGTEVQAPQNTESGTETRTPVGYGIPIGKWPTKSATVYLGSLGPEMKKAVLVAINNWNQTGAFNFTTTNNKANANIVVNENYDPGTLADGVTYTQVNRRNGILNGPQNVYLNGYYLDNPSQGYTFAQKVHTATHELGHAIGLDHNSLDSNSIMYPTNSETPIQPNDVAAVNAIYA